MAEVLIDFSELNEFELFKEIWEKIIENVARFWSI